MKKKLSLFLCLVCIALSLAACGSSSNSDGYFGVTMSEFQSYAQQNVDALAAMEEDELAYYETYDGAVKNLVTSWREATDGIGAYLGTGDIEVTKAQDTVTVDQVAHFEERDVMVTFVFKYDYTTEQLEQTDAVADLVYSMGEKMGKAALNTLIGMGTVFLVLVLISLIIYCFKFIASAENKQPEKKEAPVAAAPSANIAGADAPAEQFSDDLELVAVITAAVAAAAGTSSDGFVVRSIRRR